MRQTVRLIVIVVVLAAAFATGRWTQAQAPLPPAQQPTPPQRGLAPVVLSGGDIGFRVDGYAGPDRRPAGRLVVRVDGRWVEPEWTGGVRLLTGR
jgi:hypothetical protein